MIQPSSRLSTFDHALLYLFAFLARVGDLTRQAGLDSLVLCRKRLPLPTAKVVTAQHGRPTLSRISIRLMRGCIQGLGTPE
jgi:hypothetical protein